MTVNVTKCPTNKVEEYDATVSRLAKKALKMHEAHDSKNRVLIGISGIPGAGKTTLAAAVAAKIQATRTKQPDFVVVVPMDGYHLYRHQLAAMPNAEEAIHRRGAAFTFAADRFRDLVASLREPVTHSTETVFAPSFNHALKDPVEDEIAILRRTQIVIFEGLYLSLNRKPWSDAASLMDERWFVNTERQVARARLINRHVASGITSDREAAQCRVDSTDLKNADDIVRNLLPVQEILEA